jgi:hypothetical protein
MVVRVTTVRKSGRGGAEAERDGLATVPEIRNA